MEVRPTAPGDVLALVAVLNAIIRAGGTTAIEEPVDEARFRDWFVDGPRVICCHSAILDGEPVGFQTVQAHPALPTSCGDIATFVRQVPKVRGAGRALFPVTCAMARAAGLSALNATIRADNAGGLAYYTAMGFTDHSIAQAVPLGSGRPVDRISKRILLV